MRAAAAILSSSRTLEALADALRVAGLRGDVASLDAATLGSLGLEGVERAALLGGAGTIRALLIQFASPATLRDALPLIARRLSTRAPHVQWLVAALESDGRRACISGWTSDARQPRIASFVWETDRVVDSDAETLCALSALSADDDVLFHGRCIEVLGREALTRHFYRALETQVGALASTMPSGIAREDARAISLLYVSRLLFLGFLEAKSWLNGERCFLSARFDDCMRAGGRFHHRVLLPLFFGSLNTPWSRRARTARALGRVPFLNGGLFMRTPLERRAGVWRFPDDAMGELFAQLFQRFRFVAREDSATWSEASVDPEMLGRAFESLMARSERRMNGVFYTPHDLVARVTEHAIATALEAPSLAAARDIRVLDPACGSGAFLVHILERLAEMRRDLGDVGSLAAIRRDVLARSVFGVDRNPTAVWLCELRLWLSVVIESDEQDPLRVPPLPNLDRNIRVGDSLAGTGFARDRAAAGGSARVAELRRRYVRATGTRKEHLARMLDRAERHRVLEGTERELDAVQHARKERLAAQRARDLFGERSNASAEMRRALTQLRDRVRALRAERRRIADGGALPFSFGALFPEAQARGGFDIVLGNPPWVRLHRIPLALRAVFKHRYEVYRTAPWVAGATAARASPGFASQVDLAALFVERSVGLLRDGGALSLLLPVKLWRSLAGGGLRHFLRERAQIARLEDLSEPKQAFDAAVYPSLLVARVASTPAPTITLAKHDRLALREWTVPTATLPYDASDGAPWMMLPGDARAAFDRIRSAGAPMSSSLFGAPRLGVKSGCNAAFLVRITNAARDLASIVDADGETGCVERSLLRPALRGESVTPWTRAACDEAIIWTHDHTGAPLARLPDRARAWLRRRYDDLALRSDAARAKRWWSLFRVDAADASAPRVVWADFGRRPRALMLPAGDPAVPLNTCYVVRAPNERDAVALTVLLNSPISAAWLNAIAEPARGGYRRYLGWTVALLPIPRDWPRARHILVAASGLADEALLAAALDAYALERGDVAALVEWNR